MKSNENFKLGQWVKVNAAVVVAYVHPPRVEWKETEPRYSVRGGELNPYQWTIVHVPPRGGDVKRCLLRRELPALRMMIVGKTRRATGYYNASGRGYEDSYSEPPSLSTDKFHAVYLLRSELRWSEPVMALAEDIETEVNDAKD